LSRYDTIVPIYRADTLDEPWNILREETRHESLELYREHTKGEWRRCEDTTFGGGTIGEMKEKGGRRQEEERGE
jgi:hypothetical protein